MFKHLPLFVILLFGARLCGQQTGTPEDTAKLKKKTIKVNVIDPYGKKRVAYNGDPLYMDSVQKALKVDPALFFRGEFTLFYEWRLSRHFSLEGGAGLTYIDFLYEMFENNGRFIIDGLESDAVQFHTGISLRADARYYTARYESAIAGFYVAPCIAYRTWNMEYFVNNGLLEVPYDVHRSWTEFRIQIGEQDPDPYSVLFTEWYVNLGIQIRDEDQIKGQGVTSEVEHRNYSRVVFGAGIRIGFVM